MNIVSWAGNACLAAAGCTALHMLVGNTGVGKMMRLLTAAFFLCVLLSPLVGGIETDFLSVPQVDMDDADVLERLSVSQMKEATQRILLEEVNEALKTYDISVEKLEIDMDISEDGRISITEINLYIPYDNTLNHLTVREVASKRLGTEVRVHDVE